jgi:hypothetical protein
MYVQESAALIAKIRRMLTVAVVACILLLVVPVLVIIGLNEALEELVLFEGELILGLLVLVILVPLVVYFALRSTLALDRWRSRLDELSFALRFEAQEATGETVAVKLANQTLNALGSAVNGVTYANGKLGGETYDVVIPDQVTRKLGNYRGAVVVKRFESGPVTTKQLKDVVSEVNSSNERICRLLLVSDRDFSDEATDLHRIISREVSFPVDLIQETSAGFLVISLGT